MRILVVSDSHGDPWAIRQAMEAQPTASVVLHLGDGSRDMEDVAMSYPDRTVYQVRGNCDFSSGTMIPYARDESLGGRKVFMTHGHLYGVKSDLYRVTCAARERGADILLFGHTHIPLATYDDGLYILNPGSVGYGDGTYGLIDITPAGVVVNTVALRKW